MFNRSTTLMLVAGSLSLAPGVAAANCQCLANGRAYLRGEIACIALPGASYLARCDIELNNTSWKKIRDGCPESMDTKTLDGAACFECRAGWRLARHFDAQHPAERRSLQPVSA